MAPLRSSGPRRPDSLLHLSGEPIFLLGPSGRFVYVNPAWEALTGCPAAEVVQRDPGEARDENPSSALLDCFRAPSEAIDGSPCSTIGLLRTPDGQRFWRRLEFWPHRDREGRPLFLFGVVRELEEAPIAPESLSSRLRTELWQARERLIERLGTDSLIGLGPSHRRLVEQIDAAAMTSSPALIVGPPGSGKRQVARTIHQRGNGPSAPFVPIDCAALSPDMIDRELFGPIPGRVPGPLRLALAEGSTLLLTDLLELPRDVQATLAEAIASPNRPKVRILATTSGDPEEAVREGRLRDDLYFLLSTFVIRLSPLRERLAELPVLAQHFLDRANRKDGPRRFGFHPEAVEILLRYDWPGNLSELGRVVEYAHAKANSDTIGAEHLPATIQGHLGSAYLPPRPSPEQFPLDAMLERLEKRLIERALRSARGNKSLASKMLHISRTRLHRRIQELGLSGVGEIEGNHDQPIPSSDPE